MRHISIRTATHEDVHRFLHLVVEYRRFYKLPARSRQAAQFLTKRLRNGEAMVLLAESGPERTPAGFALIYPGFSSLQLAPAWTLNDLYVAPAYRRHGIARRLLRAIARAAAKGGVSSVGLSTAHTNRQAQALYETEGYAPDVQFAHYDFTPGRAIKP